jgi:hypothetical protein
MPDSQELREQLESLFSVRLGIYEIRRRLNELKPRLATNVRNCAALWCGAWKLPKIK